LFFFYVFFFSILDPNVNVAWWNEENTAEHYA
jgi:hypothetical protein